MHPKSSKKSRTRRVGDLKIPAFPLQRRRPRLTPGTWVLFALALTLVGAGAMTIFGESLDPSFDVVRTSVTAWSLDPGSLLVGGLVLLGVAWTSRHQRVHAAAILAPSSIDEALTEIGADLAEFRNKLYDLGNDQVEIRSLLQSMRQEAEQHHRGDRTDEVVEATFRVAGSLDTLHAKLDQRVGSAQEAVTHGIYELSNLVEASRDFLQETLEDGQRVQAAHGDQVRQQLDEVARRVVMQVPPQIVVQHPGALAPGTALAAPSNGAAPEPTAEPTAELQLEATPEPGVDSGGRSQLGEHHDANAWFRGEQSADSTEPGEESPAEEPSGELEIAFPDGPLQAASGRQETRLGLLDRFVGDEQDRDAEVTEESPSPMRVLEDMERALELEQGVEAPPAPLEVRFDQPPQAPGNVSPPGPDGTTVVQLDDPAPALPALPAREVAPGAQPSHSSSHPSSSGHKPGSRGERTN